PQPPLTVSAINASVSEVPLILEPYLRFGSQFSASPLSQVRHAQGVHNVEGEKDHNAYLSPELFDAHLTPLGWQQVDNLRKHVHASGLSKKIELVITSPLLRTMQTAVGAFGGEGYSDGIDVPPLMVAKAGNSSRPAISSLNCPPFVAVELCREHLLYASTWNEPNPHHIAKYKNVRVFIGVIRGEALASISFFFLKLIFHWQIESDADVLWKTDIRETNEDLAARGMKFMNWLWTRKEKEIAVVTHSGFLIHTLSAFGNDCHPSVKSAICKPFNNCELRSVVIVDRSLIGSDSSTTDYPGKIPSGSDVPQVTQQSGSTGGGGGGGGVSRPSGSSRN
ncbi:unnamed protein product, partial [Ilex paraguariensis]